MKKLLALMLLLVICISFGCLTSDSGNDKDNSSDKTYTVTGRVVDNSGNGIAGATVSLAGDNVNMEVSTDSEGRFSFQNIDNGTYTVISSKSGYAFSPESTQKSINNANVSDVNFTGTKVGQISHGSLSDHEGPNAAITSDTIPDVNQLIFSTFFSVQKRALESIEKIAADQPIRVDGVHSGYALFETTLSGSESEIIKDDTCDFYDFSDDSALYIGGRIRSTSTTDSENEYESETIQGDISVAGTYKGSINCNIQKISAEDDTFIGTYTAMSGGQSLSGTVTEEEFDTWEYTDGEGYTISGRIVDFSGNSIANIELSLTSAENRFTAITDDQGNYIFHNIPDAAYGLLPISPEYTFTPEYKTVFVDGADVTVDDFTGSAGGSEGDFSISGRFLDESGNAIPDVLVTLDFQDRSTLSDKEGNYYFGNIGDGDYTVTPSLEGYSFSPTSRLITVSGGNTRADFIGILGGEGYTVSGRIVDNSGAGIAGIELSLTSVANRYTAVTDDQGMYSFINVPDATYSLLPIKFGYTFTPEYKTVTVSGSDVTVGDITGSSGAGEGEYSISGRVLDESGNGLADVTIMLVLQEITTQTDKEGNYYFGNLENNMYIVAPQIVGYVFVPEMQIINIDGANVRANNFTLSTGGEDNTYSVFGAVVDGSGNALADVTVTLIGTDKSTETDKEGNYYFSHIADGEYTVVPSLSGYNFTPQSRTFTVDGSDVYIEPFFGSTESGGTGEGDYTVSGVVVNTEGYGISGVSMTLGGGESALTTVTDKDGKFEFRNIENGDYVLIPLLVGMAFSPTAQVVTVRGGDVIVNFSTYSEGDDYKTYRVSGKVIDASGTGIPDVALSLTGSSGTLETITNSDGEYSFTNVKNETYVLVPVKEGYAFSPRFMQVIVTGNDVSITFTGHPEGEEVSQVSGRVVTESGTGIRDVQVEIMSIQLDGKVVGISSTDAEGRYSFDEIFPGDFMITPSREGYSFKPESITISVSGEIVIVDDFVGSRDEPLDSITSSALISNNGGTVSVINHRGDEITLEFPPLAILVSEFITLTTLPEPPDNPIAENIFPGVTIEPEGILLNTPAKLIVTLAEPPADINHCTVFWPVQPDYVLPIGYHKYSYNSIEGEIYHFSTYSIGKATLEEILNQVSKAMIFVSPADKIATPDAASYGWQATYTTIHGLLHWGEIAMIHGSDQTAQKAIDEAKKVAEEDAETFIDEVIPPVDPCKEKDYIRTLDKYYSLLTMLGSEGSAYDKVSKRYEEIYNQCRVRLTLEITYSQTITTDDGYDEFQYQGTVTIYMPVFGGESEEFGELAGGGTLMLTGSGQSEDCTWTKAGNIDVTVSGQMESNDVIPDLNITLTEKWQYTQTTICKDQTWSQDITLDPEPATFTIPMVDGHTIDKTSTFQNTTTHITYALHLPKKK